MLTIEWKNKHFWLKYIFARKIENNEAFIVKHIALTKLIYLFCMRKKIEIEPSKKLEWIIYGTIAKMWKISQQQPQQQQHQIEKCKCKMNIINI